MYGQNPERIRLYYRHFMPYALLVLVVISIATMWFGSTAIRNASDADAARKDSVMRVVADFFENQFSEMNRIAYSIESDNKFKPYEMFMNTYARQSVAKELRVLVHSSTYIESISFIYDANVAAKYDSEQKFFSTWGAADIGTFWNELYGFSEPSLNEFLNEYMNTNKPLCIYPLRSVVRTQQKDYILYMVPMSVDIDNVNRRGAILFLLKPQAISEFIEPLLGSDRGMLTVSMMNGEVVYCTNCDAATSLDAENVVNVSANFDERSDHTIYNTPVHNLKVDIRWNNSFYAKVGRGIIVLQLITFIQLLVVGLLCAIGLSMINYKPISEVFNSISALRKPSDASIKGMANSMKEIQLNWYELNCQITRQREFGAVQMVSNLLEGRIQDDVLLLEQLNDVGLELNADIYQAVAIRISNISIADDIAPAEELTLQSFYDAGEEQLVMCHAVYSPELPGISVLIGLRKLENARERIESLINAAVASIRANYDTIVTVGVGLPVQTLIDVHGSYEQAVKSMDYEFLYGENRTYFYNDIIESSNDGLIGYPIKNEQELISAMETGQYDNVQTAVDEFVELLQNSHTSAYVARSICLSIISRFRVSANAKGVEIDARMIEQLDRAIVAGKCTLIDFKDVLSQQMMNVCSQLSARHESREAIFCRTIYEYLQSEYGRNSLSLTDIAAHFAKSSGYLARLYKQTTGTTIMAQLDEIRLEHACELLKNTYAPLDEIIEECGYTDKSNFVRKFKAKYQVTPIQYREICVADRLTT